MGSAHGRFQPLHNGHLEYLLRALQYCEFLWIGLTQINIREPGSSPADRHRELSVNNPLTYFERVELITRALMDEGISRADFAVIPFPIEAPQILPDFLPITIPVFTTVYDMWNEYKVQTLSRIGYEVKTLWTRETKEFEGATVRRLILEGDPAWKEMVPCATISTVEGYNIRERLQRLSNGCPPGDEP